MKLSRSTRVRLVNLWPPFRGLGVRLSISPDALRVTSTLKLRFWNKNIVGTQFGGALYAMVDPLFMIILMERLGPDYIVWDKGATIRFKRPGRTDVKAIAELTVEQVEEVRRLADTEDRVEPVYPIQITDTNGVVVAEVDKLMFVQRKDKFKARR